MLLLLTLLSLRILLKIRIKSQNYKIPFYNTIRCTVYDLSDNDNLASSVLSDNNDLSKILIVNETPEILIDDDDKDRAERDVCRLCNQDLAAVICCNARDNFTPTTTFQG